MAKRHTVKPGDCFSSLAKKNGFFNYLTLYKRGTNSEIRKKRKNPNMLVEGDVLKIPSKRQKKAAIPLDDEITFVVDRQVTKIRLAVLDVEDKTIDLTDCKLVVGPLTKTDKPTPAGLIEGEIDPTVKAGTLELKFTLKKKAATAVVAEVGGTAPDPPPHPPDIVAKEFLDESEKDDDAPVEVAIALQIGFLEPCSETRGAMQRLNNLGCKVPDATAKTAEDDATKRVVKSYQKFKDPTKADPSGAVADLRADLEKAHDKI